MTTEKKPSSVGTSPERELDQKPTDDSKNVSIPQSERRIGTDDDAYEVTAKTWVVVVVLALSYAISFFVVPSVAYVQGTIASQLGSPEDATWFISVIEITIATSFMICGANSDLFGRRYFIIAGNVIIFIGFLIAGTAKGTKQLIAGMCFIGFGGGNCQLAAFALPELLPNKWRHIGVTIADAGILFCVTVGPVAGRFSVEPAGSESWRWLFFGPAIAVAISFCLLVWLYHPPKHPRGIPWHVAVKELDYIGAVLFASGLTLVLTGIVYSTYLAGTNTKVLTPLVVGFALLITFALWETYATLKQPLTPTHIFTAKYGREFTAPFISGLCVCMVYFGSNIVWPTMIDVLFTTPTTSFRYALLLTLPQSLGYVFGASLLVIFGSRIGNAIGWKWQYVGVVTWMSFWGAMLAYAATPDREGLAIAFVFLSLMGYGWAQYLSIAYIQFGADQKELGIAGGLAGVARNGGGAIAVGVYSSVLSNTQGGRAATLVPAAAIGAGLPASSVPAVLKALPLGSVALRAVPGMDSRTAAAVGLAWQQSYAWGLKVTALVSIAFGITCIVSALCCVEIRPKMNNKIEVFLENDAHADMNEFH